MSPGKSWWVLTAGGSFLRAHPDPTAEQVLTGMDQNLCRCGAHRRIVAAILAATPRAQPLRPYDYTHPRQH